MPQSHQKTTGDSVAQKRAIRGRPKVRTGCITCRIRKVKCDEDKPHCKRCSNTGRTCSGYESPFKVFTGRYNDHDSARSTPFDLDEPSAVKPSLEINSSDIELLSRCFSTKTLFDIELGCDEEAEQILRASLTDPHIQHAVSSLKALRTDLETFGDGTRPDVEQTSISAFGLEQYGHALWGLASSLAAPGSVALESALLCCQVLISIEQVRKNYDAMARHISKGFRIMQEYHARPSLTAPDTLALAHHPQLPTLDVFVVKLFMAPCKFKDPPTAVDLDGASPPGCLSASHQHPDAYGEGRAIQPAMRAGIDKIAASTLEFLGKVSQVESVEAAVDLAREKRKLVDCLDSWLARLDMLQSDPGPPGVEKTSVSFWRLFHRILKVIVLRTLDSSTHQEDGVRLEDDRLQSIANMISERVKNYAVCDGNRSGGKQLSIKIG